MGNTHSSLGVTFGSVLGGLLLAPFTGGSSVVTAIAISSGVGTAIGTTAFTVNALNNRDAPKGEELSSFCKGFTGGAFGVATGYAGALGAEISVGCELAGSGIGLGITNAGDGKYKPYVGNQQEAIKYYTQKEEKLKYYMETNFHKPDITFDFIKNNYWYFHYKYYADTNFNQFKNLEFIILNKKFEKPINALLKYNTKLYTKSTYVYLSISDLPQIMKKWQNHQNNNIKKAGAHLVKAVVYGLNALENAQPFIDEKDSYAYAMYANQMDESFKNYCCHMKDALIELIQETKKAYNTGRQLAIMENTINDMYDEVAKFNAENKNSLTRKTGIYIDSEKYKLNIQQRANKVEEFLNSDFNTTTYHQNIYKMVGKIKEMINN
jgi:hypothetical protein